MVHLDTPLLAAGRVIIAPIGDLETADSVGSYPVITAAFGHTHTGPA